MKNKVKISFKDGENLRILKGVIKGEDDFFLNVDCDFNSYRINKKEVVAIKAAKVGAKENGREK